MSLKKLYACWMRHVYIPANLGEGKLTGTPENDIDYMQGCVYDALGMNEQAIQMFNQAVDGNSEPVQAIFYNDPQPDKILYQGLAWLKLGYPQKAHSIFCRLLEFAEEHINDKIRIDYFAVSLPDLMVFDSNLDEKNKNHCHYLRGLAKIGMKLYDDTSYHLTEVLRNDCSHPGAINHLRLVDFLLRIKKTETNSVRVN
jgi:tetratricopeptide (TPR) repeat protein